MSAFPNREAGAPRVSIVIVCYNQLEFFDEAIQGCLAQAETFSDLEIVIADDGSTDGTTDAARQWAERHPDIIRLALSDTNGGIAANMTAGLKAARGEFVAWLGGDDVMLPGKIVRQVEMLDRQPEVSGCYHDAEVFEWPSGEVLGLFSRLYGGRAFKIDRVDARRMLDPRVQMLPSTLLVRRDRMPAGFDPRFRFHNDYLFDFETIAFGGPYVRLDGCFVRYRKHQRSIGKDKQVVSTLIEENLMVLGAITARYPRYASAIRRREVYYLLLEALKAHRRGDHARGAELTRAVWAKGAWGKAIALKLLRRPLSYLADPRYRRLALELRSRFG
ncbi:glycosyltransferase [Sphingomonas sp. CBMAI 2297]|uniref:glycosyltransferase family 2 protein n=1 Tax=Sphingomonas sp. CBMAI 2297 TaxID=2991720 RepID=UPI002455A80D|nr:glycosyltransferase [Sphingomonas sp. CBMAI 2297]MDH4742991.1 glycosyltransferase [Sphingomonas sp. CBMAI 2297]